MPPIVVVLITVAVTLPIAWLISEYKGYRFARIALGILAILGGYAFALGARFVTELNYNAWYGFATYELIDTTVREIEDGNLDRVMTVLRSLKRQYHPTYENRANYQTLTEHATARMASNVEISEDSVWNATTFEYSTWLGHWEDDGGYWIVISDVERPYDIYRSGYPGDMMTGVTVSDDFSSIEFFEGSMWKHTVTLVNKYEAEHVWFDLEKKSEWKKERLYKLVRTTPDQKLFTQQPEPNLKKNV